MRQQKADVSALQTPPRLVASPASDEALSPTSPASDEALSAPAAKALRTTSHQVLCTTKTPLTSSVFKKAVP